MYRKLSFILVCVFVLCCMPFPAFAAESDQTDVSAEVANALIDLAGVEVREDSVISMTDKHVSVTQVNESGDFETTFISSYTGTGNNYTMINPEQLTEDVEETISSSPKARSSKSQTIEIVASQVSFSINVSVSYSRYSNTIGTSIYYFYRPYGVTASWTSTSSTATVTSLTAEYTTAGDRVTFPSCIQATSYSALSNLVDAYDYLHTVTMTQSNPTKGTAYVAYNYLASGYALWFANLVDGSTINVSIVVSGKTYKYPLNLDQIY